MRHQLISLVLSVAGGVVSAVCNDPAVNELCRRPLVILKLPRSGSTYVGTKLQELSGWQDGYGACFRNEVTNHLDDHLNCSAQVAAMESTFECLADSGESLFRGFTIDPFKFQNAAVRCHEEIAAMVRRHNAAVAILQRDNVVAQKVSDIMAIETNHLLGDMRGKNGCDGWHLYRCDNVPDPVAKLRISPDPADLYEKSKSITRATHTMMRFANGLRQDNSTHVLHFEQIVRLGPPGWLLGNTTLPDWIFSCLLCGCDCDALPAAAFTSTVPLREKLANFDKIRDYFEETDPEWSWMLGS